jgi:hypothetical protein
MEQMFINVNATNVDHSNIPFKKKKEKVINIKTSINNKQFFQATKLNVYWFIKLGAMQEPKSV